MGAFYLLSLLASLVILLALVIRPRSTPQPPSAPTPAAPSAGARVEDISTILRATADQLDTYRRTA